ncbi:Activated RNA polymerase II transcriptional coactivator p15 [Trichoplax sp. H2]|nr:Activated RNA polymerase II transcriptional coactivator p15 [Trichoplax sp. H2]|eukprot:RDD43754.1 Activated RNA polymerase II transcriptional coactivator p15 [Trichoplax sp. H2]
MGPSDLKRKRIKSAAIINSSEDSNSSAEEEKASVDKKVKKSKPTPKSEKNDSVEDCMHELSSKRYVSVRSFRKSTLVDIREYYKDSHGELKPSKKGISLTKEQWDKLLSLQKEINENIVRCQYQ